MFKQKIITTEHRLPQCSSKYSPSLNISIPLLCPLSEVFLEVLSPENIYEVCLKNTVNVAAERHPTERQAYKHTVLYLHSPYLLDWASCDFWLFPKVK